jgi:hypothetical protein
VFAYGVIMGFNGEALAGQRMGISVLGLGRYVRNKVMEETEHFPQKNEPQQKPVWFSWGFGDFDIAR